MLQKFQTVDAFKGCSTEDEVLGKVNNLIAENNSQKARIAELETTEQKYNDLMAQLVKEQKEADEKFIEDAIKDGKFTEEMKPVYVDLMSKDRENAHKIIDSLAKKEEPKAQPKKVEDYIKEDGVKCSASSWEARMKEIAEKSKR